MSRLTKGPYTTVTTDLLTLQISHKGGTIINAWLRDYPIELNSEKDFQLLSNNYWKYFPSTKRLTSS
jgi:YidC/Oxa1 family membrane protein insertase